MRVAVSYTTTSGAPDPVKSNHDSRDPELPETIHPADLTSVKREPQIHDSRSPDGSTGLPRAPISSVVLPSVNQIRPSEVR